MLIKTVSKNKHTDRSLKAGGLVAILLTLGLPINNSLAEERGLALEEITVTAQRHETKLETTPQSIIAIGSKSMETLGINKVEDMVAFVPGLKLDGNDPAEMRIALRGALTSADTPSTEQSVGYFIDGVYLGSTSDLTSDFFGIERIEVLRGPQGTLWGRNVVGGAINVVTKNPTEDFEADASATFGNYDTINIGGRISGQIAENLSGSLSFQTRNADGHTKIVDVLNEGYADAGDDLGGINTKSLRMKLRYLPNDDSEIIFAADYFNDDTEGPAPRNIVAGGITPLFTLPDDRFDSMQKYAGNLDRDIWGMSLHTNWDLGFATLSTVTAYRELDAFFEEFSFDAAPISEINLERDFHTSMFSQELRLAGETARTNWQAGLFYYNNDAERTEFYQERVHPASFAGAILHLPHNPDEQAWRYDNGETESWAVFGQLTYKLTDWLNLTMGLRHTRDKKESDPEAFSPVNFLNPVMIVASPPGPDGKYHWQTHASKSWSKTTPKFTLDALWEDTGLFDSILLFATYAEGFKSGGFETKTNPTDSEVPFDPEKATSTEAGIKTRFWDSRAQFNVTLYNAQYEGIQGLFQPPGTIGFSIFTSDAEVDGIEIDMSLVALEGLQFNLGYAYTDGTYDKGAKAGGLDISGNRLPQAPTNSLTLGIHYERELGDLGTLSLNANYGRKSGVYFNPENNLNGYKDPVSGDSVFDMTKQEILDVSLALERGNWEIALWSKNMLDDDYLMRAQDPFTIFGLDPGSVFGGMELVTGTWGAPKTYGVTVKWHTN